LGSKKIVLLKLNMRLLLGESTRECTSTKKEHPLKK